MAQRELISYFNAIDFDSLDTFLDEIKSNDGNDESFNDFINQVVEENTVDFVLPLPNLQFLNEASTPLPTLPPLSPPPLSSPQTLEKGCINKLTSELLKSLPPKSYFDQTSAHKSDHNILNSHLKDLPSYLKRKLLQNLSDVAVPSDHQLLSLIDKNTISLSLSSYSHLSPEIISQLLFVTRKRVLSLSLNDLPSSFFDHFLHHSKQQNQNHLPLPSFPSLRQLSMNNIVEENKEQNSGEEMAEVVIINSPSLSSLSLNSSSLSLSLLLSFPSSLHSLSLSQVNFSSNLIPFMQMIRTCEKIKHLDLSYNKDWINDEIVMEISEILGHRLIRLNLSHNDPLTDKSITSISTNNINLSSLNVGQCPEISHNSISIIIQSLHHLEELDIQGCHLIEDNCFTILSHLSPSHPMPLRSINLSNCSKLTGTSVDLIAKHCSHLESLKCLSLLDLSSSSFFEYLSKYGKMKDISFSGSSLYFSPSHLLSFTSLSINTLTKVMIHDNWSFDNHCLGIIAKYNSQLEVVSISNCAQINDIGISYLSSSSASLTDLNISSCNLITNKGLCDLFQHCHRLEVINLSKIKGVKDKTIENMVKNCPRVKALNLSSISKLTNLSVIAIMKLQYLEEFSTSDNQLNDPLLFDLSLSCKRLRKLTVNGGPQLHDSSILHLLLHSLSLSDLHLFHCPFITSKAVESVHRYGKNIRVLSFISCQSIDDSSLPLLGLTSSLKTLHINCPLISSSSLHSFSNSFPQLIIHSPLLLFN